MVKRHIMEIYEEGQTVTLFEPRKYMEVCGQLHAAANLLTYSMEQSLSREANRSSAFLKKFTTFYGTRWFITALSCARHLSLSLPARYSPHP